MVTSPKRSGRQIKKCFLCNSKFIMKTICLLSTGHFPNDERLFEKFSLTLKDNGFKVIIILTTVNLEKDIEGVQFDCFEGNSLPLYQKFSQLQKKIKKYSPDIIIASQPLAVIAAKFAVPAAKVYYDVTEWYPENITMKLSRIKAALLYLPLYFLGKIAGLLCSGFIFGETLKQHRFRKSKKPTVIVGYYPILKYFPYHPVNPATESLRLLFAGHLTEERGLEYLLRLLKYNEQSNLQLNLSVLLAGSFRNKNTEENFKTKTQNLNYSSIEYLPWQPYRELVQLYAKSDLFIDLRIQNFMFNYSLPIKVFESMAAGRPVIYSDLKVFSNSFPLSGFGFTVNPDDPAGIHTLLAELMKNRTLLIKMGETGRKMAEDHFNWEMESVKLIRFLTDAE